MFPSEEREGRQAYVVVSKTGRAVTTSRLPIDLAVNTLPVPSSDSQVQMTTHVRHFEEFKLPGVARPQVKKTAPKQPQPPVGPMRVEGQLSRAAAYVREHVGRRSPPHEEFGLRAPKGPPDKAEAGPKGPRQPVEVVTGKVGANIVSSPMFKHERTDRPSRLEAEGICRTLAPGKAYMLPHSSPGVASLLLKPTFGVSGIDLKRGGRKPPIEAARPCRRSDERSLNGQEPFGWAPDGPEPPSAVVD